MAAVVTVLQQWETGGNRTEYVGTIALDSSYPTGGEAIDASNNERFAHLNAQAGGTTAEGLGYVFAWDKANQKLVALYSDNNNASDGPLIQVPDTTDLSAITAIPFRALSD
jgi:hypothetical protein